jgi:hypothetical protein
MQALSHVLSSFIHHKFSFVGFSLVCVLIVQLFLFCHNEPAAYRVTVAHFTQNNPAHQVQNLFCDSIETEEEKDEKEKKEDKDSTSNIAQTPFAEFLFAHFCSIKETCAFPPFIACFENEAIEKETPPPDCKA